MKVYDATWTTLESISRRHAPIVEKCPLIYSRHIWRGRKPDLRQPSDEEIEASAIERVPVFAPVVLDVEHIPWQDVWKSKRVFNGERTPTPEECLEGHQFLATLADRFREVVSHGRRVGYYDLFVIGAGTDWSRLTEANRAIARHAEGGRTIVHAVDFIAPSLYPNVERIDQWKQTANWEIQKCRDFNKPVYPFVWARYSSHPSIPDSKHLTYIGSTYWRAILSHLESQNVDGVFVWDLEHPLKNDPMSWENKMDYLHVLSDFV